jgi:hypothetical protein
MMIALSYQFADGGFARADAAPEAMAVAVAAIIVRRSSSIPRSAIHLDPANVKVGGIGKPEALSKQMYADTGWIS